MSIYFLLKILKYKIYQKLKIRKIQFKDKVNHKALINLMNNKIIKKLPK